MDALLYNIQQKHLKLFVELNISCLLYQGCWFCLLTAHCVIFWKRWDPLLFLEIVNDSDELKVYR